MGNQFQVCSTSLQSFSCLQRHEDKHSFILYGEKTIQQGKNPFAQHKQIKSSIEVDQDYEGGEFTFQSYESLRGVKDEYIVKQMTTMKKQKTGAQRGIANHQSSNLDQYIENI